MSTSTTLFARAVALILCIPIQHTTFDKNTVPERQTGASALVGLSHFAAVFTAALKKSTTSFGAVPAFFLSSSLFGRRATMFERPRKQNIFWCLEAPSSASFSRMMLRTFESPDRALTAAACCMRMRKASRTGRSFVPFHTSIFLTSPASSCEKAEEWYLETFSMLAIRTLNAFALKELSDSMLFASLLRIGASFDVSAKSLKPCFVQLGTCLVALASRSLLSRSFRAAMACGSVLGATNW
mmetsp:Transcript_41986/g.67538  ORF Transcript_41986/g.67538 Transcript_41986/m.67538 type:complete len:241 (+) Transcript_41986:406-1128(+)